MTLETGCRPNEAAFLVLSNTFKRSRREPGCDYKAIVPSLNTKTSERYKWYMKRKANWVIELIKELHERAPTLEHLGDQQHLAKGLYNWFTRRILIDAAKESPIVKAHLDSGLMYNLRTVRSRRATDWAAAKARAEAEGKEAPPNPLQHASERTTYRSYVAIEDTDAEDGEDCSEEGAAENEDEDKDET